MKPVILFLFLCAGIAALAYDTRTIIERPTNTPIDLVIFIGLILVALGIAYISLGILTVLLLTAFNKTFARLDHARFIRPATLRSLITRSGFLSFIIFVSSSSFANANADTQNPVMKLVQDTNADEREDNSIKGPIPRMILLDEKSSVDKQDVNQSVSSSESELGDKQFYTVKPGDNFWTIARGFTAERLGHTPNDKETDSCWRLLVETNRSVLQDKTNPDLIYPGQIIKLPK